MKSRVILAVAMIPFAFSLAEAKPLVVVANHASPYVIRIDPSASPTVQGAATELSEVIAQSTGVRIPVVTNASGARALVIGQAHIGNTRPSVPHPVNIRAEGIFISADGRNIDIGYDSDRSALYSVDRFLELAVGARWYAPDDTVVPTKNTITAPAAKVLDYPAFDYRDTDIYDVRASSSFDAHLRLNGESCPNMGNFGGVDFDFAGGENFHELVPPSKYFSAHPEYFSMIDGKRSGSGSAQLCLTNDDVFHIVVDALVAQAKANPSLTTLALSPNDAPNGACQCPNCQAADARLGGPSGTELDFVNRVAAAVDKALPDRHLKVMTLAYQYLEKPPLSVRPANNVLICVCPIAACVGHGLQADPENQVDRKNLEGWDTITKPGNLSIWHYAANFRSYLQPLPDWDELGADMKYYRDIGVNGIFVEGDYQSPGDMSALRTWLIGKLLWNPDQPVWPLIDEFCANYYGAAGPDIVAYLKALAAPLSTPGVHLHIYDGPRRGVLTDEALSEADAALTRAEAKVADDTTKRRVGLVRLSLREVQIERSVPSATASDTVKAAFRDALQSFIADAKQAGITQLREGASTDTYYADMLAASK